MLSDPKEAILKNAREGNLDGVIKCLEKPGNIINHTSSETDKFGCGMTPLHMACQYGQEHVVKFLLKQANIDIYMRSTHGWLPIHSAAVSGNVEILKLLLDEDRDMLESKINDKENVDYIGCTPLLIAAVERQRPAIKYLIERGADRSAKAGRGQTLLEFAMNSSWAHTRSYNLDLFHATYINGINYQPEETRVETAVDKAGIKLHQNAGFAAAVTCLGIVLYNAPAENDSLKIIAGSLMIAFGVFVMTNKGGDAVNNVARSADRFFGNIGEGAKDGLKKGLALVRGKATATVYAPVNGTAKADVNMTAPVKVSPCIIL